MWKKLRLMWNVKCANKIHSLAVERMSGVCHGLGGK